MKTFVNLLLLYMFICSGVPIIMILKTKCKYIE